MKKKSIETYTVSREEIIEAICEYINDPELIPDAENVDYWFNFGYTDGPEGGCDIDSFTIEVEITDD